MSDKRALSQLIPQDFKLHVEMVFETLHPGQVLQDNWHIDVLCWCAEEIFAGRKRRTIIAAAPRSLKSLILSVALPTFMMGHNPKLHFMCISHNSDLALKLNNDRRKIMSTDWYSRAFPKTRLAKSTEAYFETTGGGSCRAASAQDSGVTGLGADVNIVDDLVDASDAHNLKVLQDRFDLISNSFLRRTNNANKSIQIIVGQRLHNADPIGKLMDTGDYEYLVVAAIAQQKTTYRCGARSFTRQPGQLMHAAMRDQPALDRDRRMMTAADFAAQYLQEPIPDDGGVLNWEWFKFVNAIPPDSFTIMSVDSARTLNGGDYSAIVTIACKNDQYFIVDIVRKRLDFTSLLNLLRHEIQTKKPHVVFIETSDGTGDALWRTLKNDRFRNIFQCKPRESKQERVYKIVPILQAGDLLLPRDAKFIKDLRHEVMSFPSTTASIHDDQLDAISQALIYSPFLARKAGFEASTKYFGGLPKVRCYGLAPRRSVRYSSNAGLFNFMD